jgi:hypothetical protein
MTAPEDRAKDPSRVPPVMNKERSGSIIHGGEGKRPSIVNIHEAVMDKHINVEEGTDLNPNYQPDVYKVNKKGERPAYNPWLQNQHVYTSMVQRKKKSAKKKGE